ncbi:MAG: translation initiation factor IF-2, partial [Candidatus Pacebacteria bacterium]|nr:translation initiation factor IF-2 [Candidatus Paceibacterota bacterium]
MADIKDKNLVLRPPVVVVLGHVDHGKSSILEAIKDLKITAKESGGITQHIGAYEIEHQGKKITFIDTPGHEAFSAMRSRGAKVADIAVLVVAADESIKPQTKEAIFHIQSSQIPMIVVINKIDLPSSDIEKVKRDLATSDIIVESMGGKIPSISVSAKTKQGIPDLLEMILLLSEMGDFKADISKDAEGFIIESYLDGLRGPIATIILNNGIVKKGDILGTASVIGKVRGLENFIGEPIEEALPSLPAVVLGFEEVPIVGEGVKVYSNENSARENILKREKTSEQASLKDDVKVLNIIIKADVFGSLEAIEEVLKSIPQEKAGLKILKSEVGDINDFDVKLATGARAKIIGFRVKASPTAQILAERDKITIIRFDIIYELSQAVRNLLEKMVAPEISREELGEAKVLTFFKSERGRQIIGGKATEGRIKRGALFEIIRDGEKIGKGKIIQLQQDRKETDEVL